VRAPEENFPNLFGNDRYSFENTEGSQSATRTANSHRFQENDRATVVYLLPHSDLQLLLEKNRKVKVKEIYAKREIFSLSRAYVRRLSQKPYVLSALNEDEG